MHIFGVTLKKSVALFLVFRPQQFLEDVTEIVNSQNWYNHFIGFDTRFHSMIQPSMSHTWYLQQAESTVNTHFDVLVRKRQIPFQWIFSVGLLNENGVLIHFGIYHELLYI